MTGGSKNVQGLMRKQQVKHTQESTMHESSSPCITAEYTSVTNQTPVIKEEKKI